ncbi:hypothetical protein HGM15179_000612, partial [Zosterops borbonicus]
FTPIPARCTVCIMVATIKSSHRTVQFERDFQGSSNSISYSKHRSSSGKVSHNRSKIPPINYKKKSFVLTKSNTSDSEYDKRSDRGSVRIEKILFVKIVNIEETMPSARQHSFQVNSINPNSVGSGTSRCGSGNRFLAGVPVTDCPTTS